MRKLAGTARSIAVNLPGHPSGEIICKTVDEYTETVHSFLKDAGLAKPCICGHSMGSAIALNLAVSHPEDVLGLVLVGSGAKLGVSEEIIEGLKGQPLKAIEQIITPMSFHAVSLELGREARAALSVSNLPIFLNDYLACDGFDVRPRLKEISAKTLIVCGEDDRMTPPKFSHYLHENIPRSELFFIRDAGHMVPLEKPDALAGLLQPFLSSFSQ